LTADEREQIRLKKLAFKDKYEMRLRGGYERIYPLPDDDPDFELQKKYDYFIAVSKQIWSEQTPSGHINPKTKLADIDKKL